MSDWLVAVLGELGEAANIVKKLNRVRDGIPGNKETPEELRAKLENELADADIYLSLLYQAAGIDRETAILETFNRKSKEIGYPGARTASELNARDLVDQLRDEW